MSVGGIADIAGGIAGEAAWRRTLTVEALCASAADALAAACAGADRIELNAALSVGGLTPSLGALQAARGAVTIPILPMLRPRGAGFCYSDIEFSTMCYDAAALLDAGADGLVFGILRADGTVDATRCAALMRGNKETQWVFHRAFDLVPDPFEALETLIDLGVRRILTKGQANSFEDAEPLLLRLRERARGRIEILVPGVRPHNIRRIVRVLGFDQIHLGSRAERTDTSNSARPDVYFGLASRGREHLYDEFDAAYLRDMLALLED